MTKTQVKVEIFKMAFQSLAQKEKDAVIENLLADPRFKEDFIDLAIIEQRKNEKARPFREYLAENKK